MKIRDLFEKEEPVNTNVISQADAEKAFARKGKELGSGYFATAYDAPGDVDSVVKVSSLNKSKWNMDGYYNYIEKIKDIKNETHNPYLPQIYSIVRAHPPGKLPYLVVNIEKLYSAEELTGAEVETIVRKITRDESLIGYKRSRDIYNVTDTIENYLKYGMNTVDAQFQLKDKQLLQALAIVKELYEEGFDLDVHTGNVMIRKTPYGPQLVLTDPLSFRTGAAVRYQQTAKSTQW